MSNEEASMALIALYARYREYYQQNTTYERAIAMAIAALGGDQNDEPKP